jgi:hypothetical protein
MKRFLAMSLVVLVLIIPTVLATSDLSSMSVDELIKLRTQIEAELLGRGEIKTFTVPAGTYEVGVDFPAGVFSLNPATEWSVFFMVASSEENIATFSARESHSIGANNPIGKIKLSSGEFVYLDGGNLAFSTYSGIGF